MSIKKKQSYEEKVLNYPRTLFDTVRHTNMKDSTIETAEDQTSSTIYLDSSGDLRLLVKDIGDEWRTLIVSSSAMCLASPVWRAMLNPKSHFREAERQEVEFPDDNLDALLIVLRVAHLKFRELPKSVSFDGLVNLAVVSDKYDTVGVVRPWLPQWLAPWYKESCSPGYEEWLSIAWTFGDFATFQKVTRHLIESCGIDDAGRLSHLGKPFTVSVVPDIIDRIIEGRKYVITALLENCSKLVDHYCSETPVCTIKAGPNRTPDRIEVGKECDTIIYGSLTRGLKTIGIVPSAVTSSDIRKSASKLMRELQLIRCYSLREPPASSFMATDHSKCAFTGRLKSNIDYTNNTLMPWATNVAIGNSSQKHITEQAEK